MRILQAVLPTTDHSVLPFSGPKVLISINYGSLPGYREDLAPSPFLRMGHPVTPSTLCPQMSRTPSSGMERRLLGRKLRKGIQIWEGETMVLPCLQLFCLPSWPQAAPRILQQGVAALQHRGGPCAHRTRPQEPRYTESPWAPDPSSSVQPPPPSSGLDYKSRPDLALPLPGEIEIQRDTTPKKPCPRPHWPLL